MVPKSDISIKIIAENIAKLECSIHTQRSIEMYLFPMLQLLLYQSCYFNIKLTGSYLKYVARART